MYAVIVVIAIIVIFAIAGSSNNQQQNTAASNTFFVNGEVNVRKCAAITCDAIGKYSFDGGFVLPYQSISDLPDWVEVSFTYTPTGETISGYISKTLLSLNKSGADNSNNSVANQNQIQQPQQQPKQKDLPSIIKEWRKSTAYVECYWDYANTSRWFQKESGSGLLAMLDSKPTVITNKHVVYDPKYGLAQECDIAFPDNQYVYYSITTVNQPAQMMGTTVVPAIPAHGQITFTADGTDVAYLTDFKAEGGTAPISIWDRAQNGRFACSSATDIGEPIVILGYPSYGSGAGTFVSVFSSLDITATEGIISGTDAGWYTTSAKIEHGNSGGIAIDENNDCYIGIPTASYTGQIESLGRILPASYVVK